MNTSAAPLQNTADTSPPVSNLSRPGLLLQRKCACGGSASSSLTGECENCKKTRLQKKLSIGASNDPLEQEADRVAAQVMAAPANTAISPTPPNIQRFTGQTNAGAMTAPPSVERVLAGSGRPLDQALQQDMGRRFGYDFSQVRVHTGSAAEQSAQDVDAQAYTVGQNIVFDAGQYMPGTQQGKHLIAHELTHVVQQSAFPVIHLSSKNRLDTKALNNTPQNQFSGNSDNIIPSLVPKSLTFVQRQTNTKGATGTVAGASSPQSIEEIFLCLVICVCDETPSIGVSGQFLKQVCVDKVLSALDISLNNLSPIKSEVSYDMTKTPPAPIMSSSNPRQKKAWIPDYIKKFLPNFKPATGMIRRPDVVIVQNPKIAPEQTNIKKVIEIKFPGDVLSPAQQMAYELIAGSAAKFGVLTPSSCECDKLKKQLAEVLAIIAEIIIVAGIIAALVADDGTGIGVADDPLLIPAIARMGQLVSQLSRLAPRIAPLFIPMTLK